MKTKSALIVLCLIVCSNFLFLAMNNSTQAKPTVYSAGIKKTPEGSTIWECHCPVLIGDCICAVTEPD